MNELITRTVRENDYIKQIDFEIKTEGLWFTAEVTYQKEKGFHTPAGEVSINCSASGGKTVAQTKLIQEVIAAAVAEAESLEA